MFSSLSFIRIHPELLIIKPGIRGTRIDGFPWCGYYKTSASKAPSSRVLDIELQPGAEKAESNAQELSIRLIFLKQRRRENE